MQNYWILFNRTVASVVPSLVTACVWFAVAGSMAFWMLQFPRPEPNNFLAALISAANSPLGLAGETARALGVQPNATVSPVIQSSSQYKLLGVISSASGQGSALISTDGQPAKAYRVGQSLNDAIVLVSLSTRQAKLKSLTNEFQLDLPLPPQP
jgi:general secretion pathway protein C